MCFFLVRCFGDLAFSAVHQRLKMSQPGQKLTGLPNVMCQETDSSSTHSCLIRGFPVKAQISLLQQLSGLPARKSTLQASPGRLNEFCPLNEQATVDGSIAQIPPLCHSARWLRFAAVYRVAKKICPAMMQ